VIIRPGRQNKTNYKAASQNAVLFVVIVSGNSDLILQLKITDYEELTSSRCASGTVNRL